MLTDSESLSHSFRGAMPSRDGSVESAPNSSFAWDFGSPMSVVDRELEGSGLTSEIGRGAYVDLLTRKSRFDRDDAL